MANSIKDNMAELLSPDGIQKYVLGTKKNGEARAIYDIVKDFTAKGKDKKKKHNKHKKNKNDGSFEFYLSTKNGKKKKKKKNKNKVSKHWHI